MEHHRPLPSPYGHHPKSQRREIHDYSEFFGGEPITEFKFVELDWSDGKTRLHLFISSEKRGINWVVDEWDTDELG